MLGYSKLEWILSGILGILLFAWILSPSDKKPEEKRPETASSSEIMKCSELIKKSSTHPSSVVVHEIAGTSSDRKGPGGTSRVKMEFEAKNQLGIEMEYTAICQFANESPSIQILNR